MRGPEVYRKHKGGLRLPLDTILARVEPTDRELSACRVAAREVPEGTRGNTPGGASPTFGPWGTLTLRLYGVLPDELTADQSRRTDGLLRVVQAMAREARERCGARVPRGSVHNPEETHDG